MATQPEDRTDAFAKMPGSFRERYSVLRSIGRGGMGEVFLAEDQLLRRRVAHVPAGCRAIARLLDRHVSQSGRQSFIYYRLSRLLRETGLLGRQVMPVRRR